MSIARPYLLFLGDAADQLAAKTAIGVAHWRRDWCVGQYRMDGCQADLGLPDLSLEAAAEAGARTMVIGVANRGGRIDEAWQDAMVRAMALGMDLASGLHHRLADLPAVAEFAERHDRRLFDVRHPTREFDVASGEPRSGRRLLTVGSDCSVGKMFTSLALERDMRARGLKADFRATGQTGILVAGDGVSVDAVVADFIAGAVEWLAPAGEADHWDIIEGQGSLFHASFAGVSLGLLHGAQAEALVMCHEPGRPHMRGLPGYALPDLEACIRLNEDCARLTQPAARVIGIACNTAGLAPDEAASTMAVLADRHGMPCVDPVRDGTDALIDQLG